MKHTGVAGMNLESLRRIGYSLVDRGLGGARVVGILGHRTAYIHSADPLSVFSTHVSLECVGKRAMSDTMKRQAMYRRLTWSGAEIRFNGGPPRDSPRLGRIQGSIADVETHYDVIRRGWAGLGCFHLLSIFFHF